MSAAVCSFTTSEDPDVNPRRSFDGEQYFISLKEVVVIIGMCVLRPSRFVAFLASLFCLWMISSAASARTLPVPPSVGRIVGNLDGISQDGEQSYLSGWACQQGQKASILVHVFADSATDPSKKAFEWWRAEPTSTASLPSLLSATTMREANTAS
jgi:hypothetical protein